MPVDVGVAAFVGAYLVHEGVVGAVGCAEDAEEFAECHLGFGEEGDDFVADSVAVVCDGREAWVVVGDLDEA